MPETGSAGNLSKGRASSKRPRPTSRLELAYTATLTAQQAKQHHTTTRYPSGRPSKGGANRSSNIKRVINLTTQQVTPCTACGGVPAAVLLLTEMWSACTCSEIACAPQTPPSCAPR